MSDNKKEPSFLDHLRGTLLQQFSMTPIGLILRTQYDPNFRERTRVGVSEGVKDLVRDAFFVVSYAANGLDTQKGNQTADKFEQFWRKNITQNIGMGQSEFRMGVGWKIPPNTPYNGVIDPTNSGRTINALDAVFIRDKSGKVEIMDHKDPRYAEMVLPYLVMQLGTPMVAGKALSAIRGIGAAGRVADGLGKGASLGNVGLMSGFAATQVYEGFVLRPEAIKGIADLMKSPKNFEPDTLREKLNEIYSQYSHLNGFMSEQYYVEPLKKTDNPLSRLRDLSAGAATRIYESQNPFDRITDLSPQSPHFRASINMTDVREQVMKDPQFQKGFLDLARSAMQGKTLTEQENVMLRFGLNVYFTTAYPIVSSDGKSIPQAETVNLLRKGFAFQYSNEPKNDSKPLSSDPKIAAKQVDDFVVSLQTGVDTIIKAQEAARQKKEQTIQGNRIASPFPLG